MCTGCSLGAKIKQRLVRLAFATGSFSACLAQIRHHHRPSEIKTGDHRRRTPDLSLVMLHGNAGLSMLGCCSTGRKSPRPCRWIQVEKVLYKSKKRGVLEVTAHFLRACLNDGRPGAFIGSGQAIVSWQYRLLQPSATRSPTRLRTPTTIQAIRAQCPSTTILSARFIDTLMKQGCWGLLMRRHGRESLPKYSTRTSRSA
jgi:hypothetical protein